MHTYVRQDTPESVFKSNTKQQPLSLETTKQLLPSLNTSGEGWGLKLFPDPTASLAELL